MAFFRPSNSSARARAVGYEVMAITDHEGYGNVEYVVKTLVHDCHAGVPAVGHSGPTGSGDHPMCPRRTSTLWRGIPSTWERV